MLSDFQKYALGSGSILGDIVKKHDIETLADKFINKNGDPCQYKEPWFSCFIPSTSIPCDLNSIALFLLSAFHAKPLRPGESTQFACYIGENIAEELCREQVCKLIKTTLKMFEVNDTCIIDVVNEHGCLWWKFTNPSGEHILVTRMTMLQLWWSCMYLCLYVLFHIICL